MTPDSRETSGNEWVSFPDGELEGRRPKAQCPAYRRALERAGGRRAGDANSPRALCFQCYRADLDRQRALAAAGALDTASNERFQYQLPFEAIDAGRLAVLKVERARGVLLRDGERFAERQFAERRR